jgi:hypothetical protein
MKHFKLLLLSIALTAFFAACGGNSTQNQDQGAAGSTTPTQLEGNQAEQGPEYTSAYICPMHCKGSGNDTPGTCPVCGMDYVKNDAQGKEEDHGHDHDHGDGHEGHSH